MSGSSARRPTQKAGSFCVMATMLMMTATVKAMATQRWICRSHMFQFNCDLLLTMRRQTSVCPRQGLLQICQELLPSDPGAAVGLFLIRPEARLLHAQMGSGSRRRERKGHHAVQVEGRIVVGKIPGVGQR